LLLDVRDLELSEDGRDMHEWWGGAFRVRLLSLAAAVVLLVLLLGAMAEDNDGDVDVVAVEVDIADVIWCSDSELEELPKLLMDGSLTLTVGNVVA